MTTLSISGVGSSGSSYLTRGGFDSWGDNLSTPTTEARRDWTAHFDSLKTGSLLGAVGAGGYTIEQVTALAGDAITASPNADIGVFLIGWNNLTAGDTSDQIMTKLATMVVDFECSRNLICTIPAPYRTSTEEPYRQDVNARLIAGELGSSVEAVDLEVLSAYAEDLSQFNPLYEDFEPGTSTRNGHPNDLMSGLIFDEIEKVLTGSGQDFTRKLIGRRDVVVGGVLASANNASVVSGENVTSERVLAYGPAVAGDVLWTMGSYGRSSTTAVPVIYALYEYDLGGLDATGSPISGTVQSKAHESANTYQIVAVGFGYIPLEVGKYYLVGTERGGTTPRMTNTGTAWLTPDINNRSVEDTAGIVDGVAFSNTGTNANQNNIWGEILNIAVPVEVGGGLTGPLTGSLTC